MSNGTFKDNRTINSNNCVVLYILIQPMITFKIFKSMEDILQDNQQQVTNYILKLN
jgi:hypothetical protein